MNFMDSALFKVTLTAIFIFVAIMAFASLGHCQDSTALPDAPSATLPHSKAKSWHDLIEPQPVPPKARFWTVGRWDSPQPLRSNRETLHSWTFWAGETANWGSAFALVQVTRNERQNPPIPRHGELYVDAFVPALAISGMHYIADRYICRGVGLGGVGFASAWRGYEAVKGYYP